MLYVCFTHKLVNSKNSLYLDLNTQAAICKLKAQWTLWLARAAACPCIAEGVKQGNLILYNIRTTLVTVFNQSKDRNGLWTLWSFVVICYSLIDIINYFALTLSHLKTLFNKISVTPYHIFWHQNLLGLCNISHSNFTDHLNFTK